MNEMKWEGERRKEIKNDISIVYKLMNFLRYQVAGASVFGTSSPTNSHNFIVEFWNKKQY